MYRYIFKRILLLIPVLIGVTFAVFCIDALAEGDPAAVILGTAATPESVATLHEELGLDDPLLVRYFNYMKGVVQGDFGVSYKTKLRIGEQILDKLPNTILLAAAGVLIAILLGVPIGVLSAKHPNSLFDNIAMLFALIGTSAPAFWVGLILIVVFSLTLGWFPSGGMGEGFLGMLKSLLLPAFTVGCASSAVVARMTRSAMLEVTKQDYVSLARAKGIKEYTVTMRHMLKNALIPVVTVIGLQFGMLLGGAVMTETVFAWPGLGRYVMDAIKSKDSPAIIGSVIVMALMFSIVNLVVDIIYAYLDPRIKSQYQQAVKKS